MEMKGSANAKVIYRDGTSATTDANGLINVPAAFVNDMITAGFTMTVPASTGAVPAATSITTAGAGVLTAAALAGGLVNRSGPTAAYTDTTDTAVAIEAAAIGVPVGFAFECTIVNTVAYVCTLAAGSGVTLAGIGIIPPLSALRVRVTVDSASACTFTGIGIVALSRPARAMYPAADNGTTKTLAAAVMAGADFVALSTAGGTTPTLTTDTGPNIIAAIPNAQVGQSYVLRFLNTNSGNLTVAANATGVTLTGTATVATNTWAEYLVTVATASTVTLQYIGKGTV